MSTFKDKIALVTGGARGIGRVISTRLAEQGARVIVNCFHSYDEAKQLREELLERGHDVRVVRASVAKQAQVDRMFADIEEEFGGLDLLVNNAADGSFAAALDTGETHLDRAIDTNLKGSLRCAQRAYPLMRGRGGGSLVNLSSIGSHLAVGNYLPVGTSKAALEALTRYLAVEFARAGIRVNTASGGLIEGEVASRFPEPEAVRDLTVRNTPLGRLGTPEELANVVLYLLSDDSSWVTGQTIVADGGLSLGGALLTPPSQWITGADGDESQEEAAVADAGRTPEPTPEPAPLAAPAEPEAAGPRLLTVNEPAPQPASEPSSEPARGTEADRDTIAVVGAGLVLPGVNNVDEFWSVSSEGPDLLSATHPERFLVSHFSSPDRSEEDKTYQTMSGYCDGYTPHPRLAAELGPDRRRTEYTTQWFRHALYDATHGVGSLGSARVACLIGYTADGNQHLEEAIVVESLLGDLETSAKRAGWSTSRRQRMLHQARGLLRDRYPLSRAPHGQLLPYQVGQNAIRGVLPDATELVMVDTACSSSLYALDIGIKGLLEGTHDVAICGGSFAVGPRNAVLFAKLHGLSTSGRIRPMDRDCDGVLFSDGAAAVTLKRLDLAKRDGDTILGYIGAVGTSSDGRGKAVYAPNVVGQRLAIERTLAKAPPGLPSPEWIVAHATGTPAGDLCEITSIRDVLGGSGSAIRLTSNKSLFGHTGWAAGVVSLIQVLQGFERQATPPQHRFGASPPEYRLAEAGIEIPTEERPWPARPDAPRVASVSGFGFGGTNAHVMVADKPVRQPRPGDDEIVITAWSAHVPGLRGTDEIRDWLAGAGRQPELSFGPAYDTSDMKLRMPPRVIRTVDRCQLMLLRCAEELKQGLGGAWERHRDTMGVFVGHMGPTRHAVEYSKRCHLDNALDALGALDPDIALDDAFQDLIRTTARAGVPASNEDSFPGIMPNVISARVSNYFDLKGPNMVVDLGFGSTLGAFEVAARYLRAGDVDAALVAGVNGNATPVAGRLVEALSGLTRPDLAEGAVMFAVTRRATAEADGLPVLASLGSLTRGTNAGGGARRIACGAAADEAGQPLRLGADSAFAVLRALCEPTGSAEIAAYEEPSATPVSLRVDLPAPRADEPAEPLLRRYTGQWRPTANDRVREAADLLRPDSVVITASPETLGDLGTRPGDPLVLSVAPTVGVRRRTLTDVTHESVTAALGDDPVGHVRIVSDLAAMAPADKAVDADPAPFFRLQDAVFLTLKVCEKTIREREGTVLALFTNALEEGVPHPFTGLFTGLLKSAGLELRPCLVASVFTDRDTLEAGLRELREESRASQYLPVAQYAGGVRHTLMATETPVEPGTDAPLGPDSVVVAIGGARGITPELLKAVARRHRPVIYAVGSKSLDAIGHELRRRGGVEALGTKAEFIRAELARRPGMPAREAIETYERLTEAAGALANLAEMERWSGPGRVHYRRADVTDADQLTAVFDEICDRHGTVDLLIHAAGVNRAGTIASKPLEHFQQVRHIKVQGYLNLRKALNGRPPRRWCSFSSLIGLTGQFGETDYAAANDFLASAATYNSARGGQSELSIGWTLWGETGMASSSVHHTFFESAQADTLTQMPTAEGVHHFLAELGTAAHTPATFHMGAIERAAVDRMMPGYWEPRTPPPSPRQASRGSFYVDRVIRDGPDRLVVERLFTEDRDGYLRDHTVQGVPTLPGCFVTELIAEAALKLMPGWHVTGFRDIEFHHFLKLGGATARSPRRVEVRTIRRDAHQAVVAARVVGDVVSPSGAVLVKDRVHFSGRAVLAREYPRAPRLAAWPEEPETPIIDPYHVDGAQVLLGGPFVTSTDTRLHPWGKRARFTAPVGPGTDFEQFLVPSLMLDGLARLAVLETVEDRYIPLAAPTAIRRIDLYCPDNDVDLGARGVPIDMAVTPRGLLYDGARAGSRFTATLPDGQVLLQMKDIAGFVQGYIDLRTGRPVPRAQVERTGES